MAVEKGHLGQVSVGGTVVGEVRGWELTTRTRIEDGHVAGSASERPLATVTGCSGRLDVFADSADAGQIALLVPGASVSITLLPAGVGSGLPSRVISDAVIEEIAEPLAAAEHNKRGFSFQGGAPDFTAQT